MKGFLRHLDWEYSRRYVVAFALAALMSAAFLGYSLHQRFAAAAAFQHQNDAIRAVQERFITTREDQRLIAKYYHQFAELEKAGLVGDEPRMQWAKAVKGSSARNLPSSFRFEVGPKTAVDGSSPFAKPQLDVFNSRMKLELQVFHEGVFAAWLTDLKRYAPGVFHVDKCTLLRNGDQGGFDPAELNLTARCELLWFTVMPSALLAADSASEESVPGDLP